MNTFWLAIYPHLLEAVISVLVAVIGAASTWAINSLRKKFESETAQNVLSRVADIADIVVRDLEISVVPEVKTALADGKLTSEEGAKIKNVAITNVLKHLSMDDIKILDKQDNEIDTIIGSIVEAAMFKMKRW